MKITFIQTGGTIDKDYPKSTGGWAFEIAEPAVKRILDDWKPSFSYDIIELLKKDSQEISNEDRSLLRASIQNSVSDYIVVTHGTDTMIETALFLSSTISNKRVVLTGAMIPERFKNSDAAQNVAAAAAGVQVSPPGVYICMHGVFRPASQITRDQGKFISK